MRIGGNCEQLKNNGGVAILVVRDDNLVVTQVERLVGKTSASASVDSEESESESESEFNDDFADFTGKSLFHNEEDEEDASNDTSTDTSKICLGSILSNNKIDSGKKT